VLGVSAAYFMQRHHLGRFRIFSLG
jgi:hypothetical protein